METKYKISEIFMSLQGEARNTGKPTIFIRLYGCAQECKWCDSEYAWKTKEPSLINKPDYTEMTAIEVLLNVQKVDADCRTICITGGDPDYLSNSSFEELVSVFNGLGYEISIESSGFISPKRYIENENVSFVVMDLKPPSSCAKVSKPEYISELREQDQLKMLIANEEDWNYAETALEKYPTKCELLFSAVMDIDKGIGAPENAETLRWLADKIIKLPDVFRKRARLNTQLHRLIWGSERMR